MEILHNPIWRSLTDAHAAWAIGGILARRYPADVLPFAAVAESTISATTELASIVEPGEPVCILSTPPVFDAEWVVEEHSHILQMICPERPEQASASEAVSSALSCHDAPAMLRLISAVFPGFFRSRSCELGAYIGVWNGTELAAVAGERMRFGAYKELSAVCTDPAFTGRGYANKLIAELLRRMFQEGFRPFLHVHANNVRAIAVYERLGFRRSGEVPLWVVRRRAEGASAPQPDLRHS